MDVFSLLVSGDDLFFSSTVAFEDPKVNRALLPLPSATPPVLLADFRAIALALDDNYLYVFDSTSQFRIPHTGGTPELVSERWEYISGSEVFYFEGTTLMGRPLAGGEASVIGEVDVLLPHQVVADANYVYVSNNVTLVALAR